MDFLDWLVDRHVPSVVIMVGAIVVLLYFAVKIVFGKRSPIRRLTQLLDDWQGEESRPGVVAQPGVMARLQTIEHRQAEALTVAQDNGARLEAVEAQFKNNGGSTLRDQTDRIERHQQRRTDERHTP